MVTVPPVGRGQGTHQSTLVSIALSFQQSINKHMQEPGLKGGGSGLLIFALLEGREP